ncbi:MAG: hypothetical protein ACLQU5_02565 [Isosphaeraceae bacterium]
MRTRSRVLRAAHGKFGYLMVALVALLVTAPVMTESTVLWVALALLATSVLVAGLYAARPCRRSILVGLVLGGIDIGIGRLAALKGGQWLVLLQATLWLATMTYVAVTILEVVLASQPVTMETLQAAFCVYLLLGLVWAYVYIVIELVAPGSFLLQGEVVPSLAQDASRRANFLRFLILSYSTKTTRGYGDLIPASSLASICGCLEAMMAQVYLAVVIAPLVRLQASERPREHDDISDVEIAEGGTGVQ